MSGYTCPFCGKLIDDSFVKTERWFLPPSPLTLIDRAEKKLEYHQRMSVDQVCTIIRTCPACQKISVSINRDTGSDPFEVQAFPPYKIADIPEFVPESVRIDYSEAVAIVCISPKSAATLCRRCLQTMIHDHWNIHEKNLNAEITALRGRVPENIWGAIDALRRIGNIGAHMEHDSSLIIDITQADAMRLVHLIELLISQWYVAEHNENELIDQILHTDQKLQGLRKFGQELEPR